MVKPADPLRISLSDLLSCKQGGTIASMLIDVRGFWAHDNRENLLQEEEEQVEEAWVLQLPSSIRCLQIRTTSELSVCHGFSHCNLASVLDPSPPVSWSFFCCCNCAIVVFELSRLVQFGHIDIWTLPGELDCTCSLHRARNLDYGIMPVSLYYVICNALCSIRSWLVDCYLFAWLFFFLSRYALWLWGRTLYFVVLTSGRERGKPEKKAVGPKLSLK